MAAGWRSHGPGGGPPAAHGFLRGQHHGKRSLALGLPRISHRLIGQSVCHHRCLVSYLRRLELTKSVMIVGSAPASISGIASALAPVALQVCLFSPIKLSSKAVQIGCVMDLAVQAGLLTIRVEQLYQLTGGFLASARLGRSRYRATSYSVPTWKDYTATVVAECSAAFTKGRT